MTFSRSYSKGFTLIELLVVVSIIGLLSTIVLANVTTAYKKARNASRISFVHQTIDGLELFKLDKGDYPQTTNSMYYRCLGLTDTDTCMSGYTPSGYPGDNNLNAALNPYIQVTQVPRNSFLGNYDGYLYLPEDCYAISYNNYLCRDYFLLWHLEGQTQDCSPGWRYTCGTTEGYYPYGQTQCRYDANVPGTNQC